jgi:hypothetical protein
MDSSIVLEEIKLWDSLFLTEKEINERLYEIALFKIFVKLEFFISEAFIVYATGQSNNYGYSAKRKLNFQDERHLKSLLKAGNKSFIDYNDKIKNLSEHIFEDKKNPFDIILTDADYSQYYNKIKVIRNYIAHESEESKNKYIREVLNNKEFIEPHIHLTKINKRTSISNFSIYVEKIKDITEVIANPAIFLGDEIVPKETIEDAVAIDVVKADTR